MVWSHRVVKREYTHPDGSVETTYQVHEAYYPKRGAAANVITENAIAPLGNTLEELREELERMQGVVALAISNTDESRIVLNYEDF